MKKLFLFITAILAIGAFVSCSNDEPAPGEQETDSFVRELPSANPNLRTLEEAAAIVRANMGLLGESNSRSGISRSFNPSSAKMVVNYGQSRAQLPDTLMYVFNFDNEEGFAIVAADRRLEGLIAITEKGSYDPAVGTDNPGLQYYMTVAESNLQLRLDSLNGIPANDTIGHGGLIPDSGDDVIGEGDNPGNGGGNNNGDDPITTLAQQKWEDDTIVVANTGSRLGNFRIGQHYPEGMLCSNLTSGCTVTAMYMAMSFFRYPTQIYLDYDKNAKEWIYIDWDDLTQHRRSFSNERILELFDHCPNGRHNMIAKICRYLGYHIDADYDWNRDKDGKPISGKTGASSNNVIEVMKKFGFGVSSHFDFSKHDIMNHFVRKNAIVLLSVQLYEGGGHMWVLDGFQRYQYTRTYYIKYEGDPIWYPNGSGSQTVSYIHMNWGWNGYHNGWYASGCFNPKKVIKLDEGCGVLSDTTKYYDDLQLRNSMRVITITK